MLTEPASSARASKICGPGWVAIGDCAQSYDALSSQGLWTGFRGAEIACNGLLSGELDSYIAWSDAIFADYLNERSNYYAMEQRWAGNRFWQRRHMTQSALADAAI